MKAWTTAIAAVLATAAGIPADDKGDKKVTGPLAFKVKAIDDKPLDLSQYKGKVVLFVNVASECGYTPQYKGLQELYDKYKQTGLVIVGVPSNDFGMQEPNSNEEILKFCQTNYKVTFPLTERWSKGDKKSPCMVPDVEGDGAKFGGEVGWNFRSSSWATTARWSGGWVSVEPLSSLIRRVKGTDAIRLTPTASATVADGRPLTPSHSAAEAATRRRGTSPTGRAAATRPLPVEHLSVQVRGPCSGWSSARVAVSTSGTPSDHSPISDG